MADKIISQEFLKEIFDYKDGNLYWIKPLSGKAMHRKIAGNLNKKGRSIGIYNKNYLAHRLIFLWHHGYLPKYIDHIDGNPFNNKIENLREATHQQNMCNSKKPVTNTSGYKNVSWQANLKKWRVRLTINKKSKQFGVYDNIEEANIVAIKLRKMYFGEFARDS